MSRRVAGSILGIALLLVLGGGAWWWLHGRSGTRGGGRSSSAAESAAGVPTERHPFDLYFPASGGGLRAERRELAVSEDPKDRIRKVLEAVLAGPTAAPATGGAGAAKPSPGGAAAGATQASGGAAAELVRPFPPEVKLGSVQLSADGIAYLDLRWNDHEDPPESGSTEEIQRVYSLVDSAALNVPEVNRVVLLWNGTQRLTFSGHLDISRPLVPDRTLLAP
jgi:Sporulation and spore germination